MQILNSPCVVGTIISDQTHGVGSVTFARTLSFSNRVSSVSTLSLDATCTFLGTCCTGFTVLSKWMWCFPGSFSRPVKTSSYSWRMVYSVMITWLSTSPTRRTVLLAMTLNLSLAVNDKIGCTGPWTIWNKSVAFFSRVQSSGKSLPLLFLPVNYVE